MAANALMARGLWKEYSLGAQDGGADTLYEAIGNTLKAPWRRWRRLGGAAPQEQRFWALRDIAFDVPFGEVVGVIGRNGAGKSTLLKILSRITAPTRGHVEVRGRLASLLEVGTGFHPELSGRENIFLNGAILGMKRREVQRKFDEIVAFAEVERFIDTPVKHYSSGMYVRLAFAVAAFLEVDVLVVDEVLAVGDSGFQEKCLAKMEDVSSAGRTVLFVSHNLSAISRLCTRGILLHEGSIRYDGAVDGALKEYTALLAADERPGRSQFVGSLTDRVAVERLSVNGSNAGGERTFLPEEAIDVALDWTASCDLRGVRVVLQLRSRSEHVFSVFDGPSASDVRAGAYRSTFRIPPFLLSPQNYWIGIGIYSEPTTEWTFDYHVAPFSVARKSYAAYDPDNMGQIHVQPFGVVGRRTAGVRAGPFAETGT